MKRTFDGLFTLTEWVMKFVYLNLLWVAFTLLGLIFLGFTPATVAMFTIIRKWSLHEPDIPLFSTFVETYKKEFWSSNRLLLILLALGGLAFLNLYFLQAGTTSGAIILVKIPLYLVIFSVVLTLLYLIPVYVHYELTLFQMVKNAFFIMLINPVPNLVMIIGIGTSIYIMSILPGLAFFFGGSIIAGIMMSACMLSFQRVWNKQKEAQLS